MSFKKIIKQLLPPIFTTFLKNIIPSKYGWSGNYTNWIEAKEKCVGYDAENILEKCKGSLLRVKSGEAAYERDSVLFDKIEYSWPVLTGLLKSAIVNKGKLHVLDFGGSLGSSYYQNRAFLTSLNEFSWNVVEQEAFVKCGQAYFEDGTIKFFKNISECASLQKINTLLLSSVLQYLEDPYEWINTFSLLNLEFIIIDLVGVADFEDRLTIQNVPPSIYEASYPCWIFNERRLIDSFSKDYRLVADFDSYIGRELVCDNDKFKYRGFIFQRRFSVTR